MLLVCSVFTVFMKDESVCYKTCKNTYVAYNCMFEELKHCEAQANDDSLFASLQ